MCRVSVRLDHEPALAPQAVDLELAITSRANRSSSSLRVTFRPSPPAVGAAVVAPMPGRRR
jgi:hypothetical protein